MSTITDPDILQSELVFLKAKEEELVIELEQVRASIGLYENEMDTLEEP